MFLLFNKGEYAMSFKEIPVEECGINPFAEVLHRYSRQ